MDAPLLPDLDQALLGVMILVIMFGMGASLTPKDFKIVSRRPRMLLVGFLSQFGFMPLIGLGLALALDLEPALAIALVLIGSLPGGTTSNMFSYFARGAVALSIAMTTASTLLALAMTPLLLEAYTRPFTRAIRERLTAEGVEGGADFLMPTGNIVVSLVLVLVPVLAGMLLRKISRGWAKVAEDTAGFMGMIVIVFLIVTTFARNYRLLFETSWRVYLATVALGWIGFLFGYGLSRLFRAHPIEQRAIALETGIQNTPVAFAVILLSFKESSVANPMLWLSILYSVFIVISSSLITLWLRKRGRLDCEVTKNPGPSPPVRQGVCDPLSRGLSPAADREGSGPGGVGGRVILVSHMVLASSAVSTCPVWRNRGRSRG